MVESERSLRNELRTLRKKYDEEQKKHEDQRKKEQKKQKRLMDALCSAGIGKLNIGRFRKKCH